jgi:Methylamine utilisation protein MauE
VQAVGAGTLLASGAVGCTAIMLALFGIGKTWRGDTGSALRAMLRIGPGRWRLIEAATGFIECAVGVLVFLGAAPLLAGTAMAALGAVFCGLLVRARRLRVPGGCGCTPWRRTPDPVSWRTIVRAGCVTAAGVAAAAARPSPVTAATHLWFVAGAMAAAAGYAILGARTPLRTPRCHRRVWLPARDALRALRASGVFAGFAQSYGPFAPGPRHSRHGCADLFAFTPLSAGPRRELVFRVSRGSGGTVAVRATASEPGATGPGEAASKRVAAGSWTASNWRTR